MADVHFFNTDVAKKYGVNCAVILQNLWHWIKHNEANNKNFHDGHYWTYNSTKAFKELFPYLSQKQIETALKKLREDGILITGNYNQVKYDRTLWYAITEKGKSILLGGEMDSPKKENGNYSEGEPIPNSKPVCKTQDVNSDNIKEIVAYLNQKLGTQYKSKSKETQKHIHARLEEGYTVEDFKKVIDIKTEQWLDNEKMQSYLRPKTLFSPKFETYLNEYVMNEQTLKKKQPQELPDDVKWIFQEG